MGLPSLQAMVMGGGWVFPFFARLLQGGGGLENCLGGRGGGQGCGRAFLSRTSGLLYALQIQQKKRIKSEVASVLCYVVHCCGVLWSCNVCNGVMWCGVVGFAGVCCGG